MPHDRDKKELRVGDLVNIAARIIEIHQTAEFCNVTLETLQPMPPSGSLTRLHLNAMQVVRDPAVVRKRVPRADAGESQ